VSVGALTKTFLLKILDPHFFVRDRPIGPAHEPPRRLATSTAEKINPASCGSSADCRSTAFNATAFSCGDLRQGVHAGHLIPSWCRVGNRSTALV